MNCETRITTLENGVQVATTAMPYMASASIGFWVRIGSRQEPLQINGIAHFIEHLLFKGTPTRSAEAISRQIESLGASIDGFTVEDHTCYNVKGPAEQLEPMLDVLSDFFLNPVFDPAEIESERNVIREEISMIRDLPGQWLEDLLSESAWGTDHPLGRPITGSESTLNAITRSEILTFFKNAYSASQTVVSIAGNIDHDEALKLVSAKLSGLQTGEPLPMKAATKSRPGFLFEAKEDVEQAYIAVGYRSCHRSHPDRYAQKIMNVLLGENMSSRLFQVLREQAGLCYEIQSDIMSFEDAGMIHLFLALDPENVPEALTSISEILRSFRDAPPSEDEMEEAKAYAIGQSKIALENTASQMMWAGESLVAFGEWVDPEDVYAKIKAVTPEDIQAFAGKCFQPSGLSIAGIGPQSVETALLGWQSVS